MCRMRFWYWDVCGTCKARIPDSEIPVDVREWSRFHGKQLVQDLLKHPEQRIKLDNPERGSFAFQRLNPYFCNVVPGILGSADCNHDASLLLRMPVLRQRLPLTADAARRHGASTAPKIRAVPDAADPSEPNAADASGHGPPPSVSS